MAIKARFEKGQTIFQVSQHFSTLCLDREGREVRLAAIVSRKVDACGVKQVSFYDEGNDSIFGRSSRADSELLFATAAEAFDWVAANHQSCPAVVAYVIPDSSVDMFDRLRSGELEICPTV